jgi:hypothetical protein
VADERRAEIALSSSDEEGGAARSLWPRDVEAHVLVDFEEVSRGAGGGIA